MSAAHTVFVIVAAALLPALHQIARCYRDLFARSADYRVISDPIGIGDEEIDPGVNGLSALGHFLERRKFLFAAAAWIVDLKPLVVSDLRKVGRVKERAVVGELR